MDLNLTKEEIAFRTEVRRFFETDYPTSVLEKLRRGQTLTRADHVASQAALQSRGWLGVSWPKAFGGPGWSPIQRYLFDAELEQAGAPNLIPMAIIYIGPIICAFGTPEQQARWLPDILASKALWAQGYSEPESGSDLASLRMSAVRDGDDYVLNGSKIWTSGAHWADWIFCLTRTSAEARKQDGISLICTELDRPGVTVTPIISIDGRHELNRVDFDDVRTPVANRIGEEGKAWRYANELLKNERLSYAHIARKQADLRRIRALAATMPADGAGSMLDDAAFQRRLATVEIEVETLEISVLRALIGGAEGAAVATLKVLCTECAQHVTALFTHLAGRSGGARLDRTAADWATAAPLAPSFATVATQSYLFERAQTIYGGATEIQKHIAWRSIS
ncbi:MAG: acyl-CoA dehydrogenase family protein [Caulobacteraceae bacterium]|jgi:alkylation response protein AidB-like acyl-CoA dehydrogenase